MSLVRLSHRESWWKDAEILMLRHQLAIAHRQRPRVHARLTWPDRAWLAPLAGTLPIERLGAMELCCRGRDEPGHPPYTGARARPYPAPAIPSAPGIRPGCAPLAQLAGTPASAHAAVKPAESLSLDRKRVRTEVPSGLSICT